MKKCFAVVCAVLLLSGCAKDLHSTTYSSSSTAGKVLEGKIINARTVTVKEHDKLQENTTGGLIGGGAGLAAGSQIGRGSGNIAADVGGAVIGAVAGALAQDALSTTQATEYLVRIDKPYIQEYRSISKKIQNNGKSSSVEQDMTATSVPTKTNIVSVVQAPDAALKVGSHVYIIYNDDRPRLVADSQ